MCAIFFLFVANFGANFVDFLHAYTLLGPRGARREVLY